MKSKVVLLSLAALLSFSSSSGQKNISQKLIGKWEAKDSEGVTGGLNFLDSSNIIVTIPGQPLPIGTYKIDTTKNPVWLDITIKQGQQELVMKGLMKLITDTTLKWQYFEDGNRASTFTKETDGNTIILKKNE